MVQEKAGRQERAGQQAGDKARPSQSHPFPPLTVVSHDVDKVHAVLQAGQVQACAGVCRGGSGAAGCVGLPVVERLLLLLEAA